MSNNYRELTGREKQWIRKLVTSFCANYDKEYSCLPLDCNCPMFGIGFTNSALCRYFRKAVLPEDAELEAIFTQTPTTHCKQCGTTYKVKVVFSDTEKGTMEDKILRMICNETVTTGETCSIMDSPQMSRQSERSAS